MMDAPGNAGIFALAVMKPLLLDCFGMAVSEAPAFLACFCSGSSLQPDLRGLSLPSSPSFTPNAPTVLCSGKSEPNLNIPLNVSLNSSLSSNYHTTFSSSTGWPTFHFTPSHTDWNTHRWDSCRDFIQRLCVSFFLASGTTPSSPFPSRTESLNFTSCSSSWSDECSICYENMVDAVLYACGHMCLCYTCGLKLKKMANACCPICRRTIKDIIKIYRSA